MADELFKINGKVVTESTQKELDKRAAQLTNPESPKNSWVTQRQVWFQLTSMAEIIPNKKVNLPTPVSNGFSTAFAANYAEQYPALATAYYQNLTPNQQNQLQSSLNISVGSDGVIKRTTTQAQKVIKSVPQNFSTLGGLYDEKTLRPSQPSVTNIKVTKQGELGSTRKATVDITFFSTKQFEEYEPYLFVPGISLRLEWGWSIGAEYRTPPKPMESVYMSDPEATNKIQERVSKNPNYDGFQGRVVNFSYSVDGDVWKATVEIISAGSGLSEKKIDDTSCNCSCKQESADGKDKEDGPVENIPAQFMALHNQPRLAIKSFRERFGDRAKVYYIKFAGRDRDEKGEEEGSGGGKWARETFVTLETLATAVNMYTGYVSKDNPFKNADGEITFRLNNKPITVQSHPEIVSTNPYVCILPGQLAKLIQNNPEIDEEINDQRSWARKNLAIFLTPGTGLVAATTNLIKEGDFSVPKELDLNRVNPNSRVEQYLPIYTDQEDFYDENGQLKQPPPKEPSAAEDFNNSDNTLGYLGNILINTRHALKVFKSCDKTLGSFFLTLLKDVNHACGDFWEFDIVDITSEQKNSKDGSILTIVDIKDATKAEELKVYEIPSKPIYNNGSIEKMSIVRSLDIKTKLTEGMKTQALYADGPSTGITDECPNRFSYIRSDSKNVSAVANRGVVDKVLPKDCCTKTADCDEELDPKKAYLNAMGKVLFKNSDERAEAAAVAFKNYMSFLNKQNQEVDTNTTFTNCPTIPYPFELSVGLDGIGGFKWGQYITTNRLPERYRTTQEGNTFVWQVTTVEQDITPNDWKTNIQTILRYTSKKVNNG